jgi:hypothetical protein
MPACHVDIAHLREFIINKISFANEDENAAFRGAIN